MFHDDVALNAIQRKLDEQKGLLIHLQRQERSQRGTGIDLAQAIVRAIVCKLKVVRIGATFGAGGNAETVAEKIYGRRHDYSHLTAALNDLPDLIQRAAVNPAQTTVSGWGSELVSPGNIGVVPAMAPSAVYSKLAPRGLRLNFDGSGPISVPGRLSTPTVAGDFVLEASPIPVRRVGLSSVVVGPPKKLGVISYFSDELKEHSVPSIEAALRAAIEEDTALTLDTRMLDAVAGSATRPAGLLNGVSGLTATAGGGLAALVGDLGLIGAAIPNATDLVYLMNASDRARALALAPGLLGLTILEASTLPAKKVVALDASDLVTGENDQARFDVSNQAVLHDEDTTPLALGTGTQGSGVLAVPTHSMFQENLSALRMIMFVTWALRRSGRIAFIGTVSW